MWQIVLIIAAWIVAAIAAERSAEAIAHSEFFAPLRSSVARLAYPEQTRLRPVFGWVLKLISCGYCVSGWTALLFSCYLPVPLSAPDWWILLLRWMALWGLANWHHNVFQLVYRGRVGAFDVTIRQGDSDGHADEPIISPGTGSGEVISPGVQ